MKLLLVCVAVLAVAQAMPVAEEKDVALAPAPASLAKAEEPKQKLDEKPALAPEIKKEEKPIDEKPAVLQPKPIVEVKEPSKDLNEKPKEVELQKSAVPEVKSNLPAPSENSAGALVNNKPVNAEPSKDKQEDKVIQSIPKPSKEEPKAEEATVKEIANEGSSKSAAPKEYINIVDAIKIPAAVADEVVDDAAIIPQPEKKIDLPAIVGKSADEVIPENKDEKNKDSDIKLDDRVPAENKEKETPVSTPVAPVPVSDESLRVLRDIVDDKASKPVVDEKKPEAPAAVEAPKEVISTLPAEKSIPKPEEPIKVVNPAIPVEAVKPETPKKVEESKPQSKPIEKPVADAPKNSSEESFESDSAETESEESGEKKGNAGAPKS